MQHRPSLGLALSGGGAHGITHIGVLKVMEEAGLRPDYITGVSMGSIVGGLYSMGYSADTIQRMFKKMNWNVLLSNRIPENRVIYIEKKNLFNSIISLPVSMKKVILPSGLINGQLIENTLSYYMWSAAAINDFSKLPIPFMCLGTDLITYKKIELKSGYLPDAIRASFAVPTIFTPLKIDSLLLVDGGLTRNFAPREARQMGADIVIGSYVGFHAYNESELQSVAGIMKQIALFRSLEDFRDQEKYVDILIKPVTKGLSISGFDNVDQLVQRGYEAALPFRASFKKLADSLNAIGPQKPLKIIPDRPYYAFDKLEVIGNSEYSSDQILGVLDIKPGDKVDRTMLTDKIELLYGKAWFEKVKYRITPRNDSLILVIDCIEKPQSMIYGAAHYDNALLSGIKVGLSLKNLLTQRSVINVNSLIAQYFRVELNAVQFLDRNQKFDLAANFQTDNTLIPRLRIRGEKGAVVERNFTGGLSLDKRLGLNHMMNLSMNFDNRTLLPRYDSDNNLKRLTFNYVTETFEYHVNTLNSKHFPDNGLTFNTIISSSQPISATIRSNLSETFYHNKNPEGFLFDRFYTLNMNFVQYFSPSERVSLSFGGNLLYITKCDSISSQNNFYLVGGIDQLNSRSIPATGYHPNEIPVRKMAGVNGKFDYEFINDLHLEIMSNFLAIEEVNRLNDYALISGFGLGLGYMSAIGPIRIGAMYGSHRNDDFYHRIKGYISIGYNF